MWPSWASRTLHVHPHLPVCLRWGSPATVSVLKHRHLLCVHPSPPISLTACPPSKFWGPCLPLSRGAGAEWGWNPKDPRWGTTHRSAGSSPDARSPECRPPGSTRAQRSRSTHGSREAQRARDAGITEAASSQGPRAQGVVAWGAGGRARPTPAHTHCQRSFPLLASGASRSWPPLRATGGTRL